MSRQGHGSMISVKKGSFARAGAFRLAGLFLACFLFMPGCATDRIGMDLIKYANQGLLGIADLERSALDKYAFVTGTNYTTDKKMYNTLKQEVIPRYRRFLDLLMEIRPETDEVRELNGIYIGGARELLRGFRAMMRGIEKQDKHLIREANKRIKRAQEEIGKWRKEFYRLCADHGVGEKKE